MKKSMVMLSIALSVLFFAASQLGALTLYSESFDDNSTAMSGWKRSSVTYVSRYTGTYKVGDASMQIVSNFNAETDVKTPIFKNMVLKFKMAAYGFEAADKLYCEYMTGSTWVAAATLSDGADTGAFISYSVNIPNCVILKIRFRLAANSTADYGYADDVVLTGDRW